MRVQKESNEANNDSTGVGPKWSDKKKSLLQTLEKRISRVDSNLSTLSDVPTLALLCKEPGEQPGARPSELLHMAEHVHRREPPVEREDMG